MIVAGLDPSSQLSGSARAVDDELEEILVWKKKGKETQQQRMVSYGAHVRAVLTFWQPDLVVIEECGPQRNAIVFRTLVRFEAVAQYEALQLGIDVLLVKVAQARLDGMGGGNMGKETVYAKLVERYPDLPWLAFDKGGNDQSDAGCMALAGSKLILRR